LPVEPLTQQQSLVRGERPFNPENPENPKNPEKLSPQKISKIIRAFYVQDCYVREKFVAPFKIFKSLESPSNKMQTF
jgi:hypothetical protein